MAAPAMKFDIIGVFFRPFQRDSRFSKPAPEAATSQRSFITVNWTATRTGRRRPMDGNNPAEKNSLGGPNRQKNLSPLENWNVGGEGATDAFYRRLAPWL